MTSAGLREQKKTRTRQLIADAAIDLFGRHGYDAVTVEAVAAAAEVSKKTVFNHFPTKEDLVFARVEDREGAILAAVRDRASGTGVLAAFQQLCRDQTVFIERFRSERSRTHYDLLAANPVLRRRALEINAHLSAVLAAELGAARLRLADDPVLTVVARTLVEAQSTLYRALRERVLRGGTDADIVRAHRRDVDRVFAQLGRGFADLP